MGRPEILPQQDLRPRHDGSDARLTHSGSLRPELLQTTPAGALEQILLAAELLVRQGAALIANYKSTEGRVISRLAEATAVHLAFNPHNLLRLDCGRLAARRVLGYR